MAPKKQQAKNKPQPKKEYDYSGLEKGMRVQAESEGTYYAAEVVQVSTAKSRAKAPVKISFKGYEGYDAWVAGDKLRSKALKVKAPEKPEKKEKPKMQLQYWPIFAKNIAPALALEFGGFDWECGKSPGDKGTGDLWAEWMEMKFETVWAFLPNLKIDDKKTLGSELVILQYLAQRRRNLGGLNDDDWLTSQELMHQSEELYQKMAANLPTIMAKDKDKGKYEEFMSGDNKSTHSNAQGLQVYLKQFEDFYATRKGKDGKFTRSGKTVGELKLFATLQMLVMVKVDVLASYPNLTAFMKRLTEDPKVKGILEGTAKNMGGPKTQYFIAPP
jgi:glutathione S-transferase